MSKKIKLKNYHKLWQKLLLGLVIILVNFVFYNHLNAAVDKYAPGDAIVIGEFVYDDDLVATTTPCTISVFNPSNSPVLVSEPMTALPNGWHYYSTTTLYDEGIWPATMTCGSALAGDLANLDKTFVIGYVGASTTAISNSVWNNSATSSIASVVNANNLSALNDASSSIVANVNSNTNATVLNASSSLASSLPALIWGYSGRTLTSFGTLVADIAAAVWSNASRSLTTFGSLASDVWTNGTRTLTSLGSTLTASDVWSYATRNLTDASLTSGSLALQGDISGAVTTINNNTNATVLNASTSITNLVLAVKAKTDNINWSDVTTIKDNVATIISEVGTGNISAIKTKTDTIAWANITGLVSSNGDIKAKTDTIAWGDVTGIKTKTDTISWADVTGIKTKTDTILWSDIATLATKTDLNNASSSLSSQLASAVTTINNNTNATVLNASTSLAATIPIAVWSNASRSLTTFGSLASDVWTNGTRTLTSLGSTLTASDVWSYATRNLTDASLTSGSLALQGDISGAVTTINNNTNATVLNASTSITNLVLAVKAKTDNINWSDVTTIKDNVATIISEVGTGNISAIKTKTDTIAWANITGLVSSNGDIKAKTDTIAWGDVTGIKTKTDTISWADVTGIKTKTDTILWSDIATLATKTDLNNASSALSSQLASAVTTINNNTNATVLNASTSLAATIPIAVWSNASRSLTTFGSLASDVWTNGTRTLTSLGSTLTASDVWSYATRNLTDASLTSGSLALQGDISGAVTTINNNTNSASSSLASRIAVETASSSVAVNTNTNSQVAGAVTSVNSNTNTQVLNASTSLASAITAIPANVWTYSARTLSSFGALATDIWSATTRTITGFSAQALWSVTTSDFGSVVAGSNYLATVTTVYDGTLTDSANIPTVTIYDPNHNVIVSGAAMTRVSLGTYTYSYTTPGNAPAGTWQSVFSATVEPGKTLPGNDYWTVVTTPAQVIINSVSDNTIPTVGANITITNEGLSGNEYQYEWCVVSDINNSCGGGDDVFHAIAAKYINAGEDFNTTLTASVPTAGNYYFKTIVYFGTESSGASRSFTAVADTVTPPASGGGGGGGGGGGNNSAPSTSVVTELNPSTCRRASFNCDKNVDSIDFSILLYFWKTKPPFKNQYVDLNKDGKVDSIDFSILLYEWGKK